MSRQRVPKGQIFLKKDEKISATLAALPPGHTEDRFVETFKELYPEDWSKVVKRFDAHERLTPEGKSHPMANPHKYMINAYRAYKRRAAKSAVKPA